jgi:hypothetical protein
MRKALLMAGALLAMTATLASASGVELAWNQCFGQAGALSVRTSACASNTGNQAMYASFRPPAGVAKLEGLEAFIDYQVLGGSVPCWWNFAVGQTRNAALTTLHVTPTDVNGAPVVLCDNHYFLDNNGGGGGGMVVTGVDRGQLKGLVAIGAGSGLPVTQDAQQYGMGFRITNVSTTGGTCPGCLNQACFVLNTINLTSFGVPNVVLQAPHPGSENWISWQGTSAQTGCPGATPTRNATWGSVKSLYR